MKVGDLVKVKEDHYHLQGEIGIIVEDIFNKGKGFKVLFANGIVLSKLKRNLELLKTDKNCP